ncbi:hypothetical protein NQ103_09190, partial [Vibrio parahaemolyticus]|nr:hypothetical protein [Vibrio parahaemolyticus]
MIHNRKRLSATLQLRRRRRRRHLPTSIRHGNVLHDGHAPKRLRNRLSSVVCAAMAAFHGRVVHNGPVTPRATHQLLAKVFKIRLFDAAAVVGNRLWVGQGESDGFRVGEITATFAASAGATLHGIEAVEVVIVVVVVAAVVMMLSGTGTMVVVQGVIIIFIIILIIVTACHSVM